MEKLTIEQLIRKVADMKALYKNVEKKGNRLASEFCKTLEGGFFAATRDGGEDVTVQYIKVNGAKRKGEHIRLDVDGVEIGRYDNGSIGYVQRLNCLEY